MILRKLWEDTATVVACGVDTYMALALADDGSYGVGYHAYKPTKAGKAAKTRLQGPRCPCRRGVRHP